MNIKVFNLMSRTSELMFVMIDNARIMINADKNVKNWLIKVTVMVVLFGILVRVHVNVKSLVMLWILRLCECKCRKRLIHNLVEKCDEDIHRKEIIYNATLCGCGRVGRSCTPYVVLLIIACIMIVGISGHGHFYRRMKTNYFNALSC